MLHSLARAEMRRQDIRRKLQDTDTELMDILRRFAVSVLHKYHIFYYFYYSNRVFVKGRSVSLSAAKTENLQKKFWKQDNDWCHSFWYRLLVKITCIHLKFLNSNIGIILIKITKKEKVSREIVNQQF